MVSFLGGGSKGKAIGEPLSCGSSLRQMLQLKLNTTKFVVPLCIYGCCGVRLLYICLRSQLARQPHRDACQARCFFFSVFYSFFPALLDQNLEVLLISKGV